MPVIEIQETIALDASADVRYTREGYLVAMPRVARSGIQIYRGDELGKPDMAQVRVYRPEAEVFSKDSLGSYAHRPVTNDHPPEPVTADNWSKYAKGQTGDEVVRDGSYVRVPMVLMDGQAIKDYKDGKRELSQGYAMDLHWEAGKTKDGEDYDAIMKTIRQNHLALVKRARGGPDLRIGDDWRIAFDQFCDEFEKAKQGVDEMEIKTTSIMIGDQAVQVHDISAPHVLRTITGLQTELGELRGKMEKDRAKAKEDEEDEKKKGKDALDALAKTHAAEVTTIKDQLEKSKLTPAALDALVLERVTVTTQAKALLGDRAPKSFTDKTVPDIRRLAVDAILGDKAKGWDDNSVSASFTALASQTKDANGTDPIRQTFQSHDHNGGNAVDRAWGDMVKDTSEAWRAKPAN